MPNPPPSRPNPRRDSWPPTQVRLRPSIEPDDAEIDDLDLSFIDDDPLNYFLTPAPPSQDDDDGDDTDMLMLDLDAGIENAKRPAPIVRSVSPSSLDGGLLLHTPRRPPTPPRSTMSSSSSSSSPYSYWHHSSGEPSPEPDLDHDMDTDMTATPDDDDEDGESYLPFALPFSLKDLADARSGKATTAARTSRGDKGARPTATLLSPAPPSGRGRLARRPGPRPLAAAAAADGGARTRSWSGRSSPRAWRQPSPEVWAIEEEPEREGQEEEGAEGRTTTTRPVDVPDAKPKKRVRFVLPGVASETV